MPVLSTIEVTLRDAGSEERFLSAFVRAAGHATGVPGLIELKAFKLLGKDRSYLAWTLWENEEWIEEWMAGHREQEYIQLGKSELLESASICRFSSIGEPRDWKRE
jgi:heme-degrading monooxygenase HmoA